MENEYNKWLSFMLIHSPDEPNVYKRSVELIYHVVNEGRRKNP